MEFVGMTGSSWSHDVDLKLDRNCEFEIFRENYLSIYENEEELNREFKEDNHIDANQCFQEEENNKVNNNNNNYTVENHNLKEISFPLADSSNELDLIDYWKAVPSPTLSSATSVSSSSSIEQLLNELTNKDSEEIQSINNITDEPVLQASSTTIASSSLEQLLNHKTILQADSSIMNSHITNHKCVEDRAYSNSTDIQQNMLQFIYQTIANQKVLQTTVDNSSANYNKSLIKINNEISEMKQPFTDLALAEATNVVSTEHNLENKEVNFPATKNYSETYSSVFIEKTDSMQPSPTAPVFEFHPKGSTTKVVAMTRKERNCEASKKLRKKRKIEEEELNMREKFSKRQKLELEKKRDESQIMIEEIYKFGQMLTSQFAQDNLSKFTNLFIYAIDLKEKLKQDPDYNKVFNRIFKYFEKASVKYISLEDGAEIARQLEQHLQKSSSCVNHGLETN